MEVDRQEKPETILLFFIMILYKYFEIAFGIVFGCFSSVELLQVEGKEADVPPYKRFTKNITNKSAVNADEIQETSEPSTSGDFFQIH